MSKTEEPNVVLFMCDQLSAKWLEAGEERNVCELRGRLVPPRDLEVIGAH